MTKKPSTEMNIHQMRKKLLLNSYEIETGPADIRKIKEVRKIYETILYSYQLEIDYMLATDEIGEIGFFENDEGGK